MISLQHIYKEMLSEKVRFFLTILAIAWGTASITTMLAVGEGLKSTFTTAMNASGSNLLMADLGTSSKAFRGRSNNIPVTLLPFEIKKLQQMMPDLTALSTNYNINTSISHGDHKAGFSQITAVYPDFATLRDIQLLPGSRFINPNDINKDSQVVVLGSKLSKQLFPNTANPINKKILIGNWPFTVIGVAKHKMTMLTNDDYSAWLPASTYLALSGPNTTQRPSFILLSRTGISHQQIKAEFLRAVANLKHFDPSDNSLIYFQDFKEFQEKTNMMFTGIQIFLGFIGGMTLLVAGIGIANVMFVSVRRATRQIGIQMAIGARTYHILLHYVAEALLVTLIGGALGFALSELMVIGIKSIPIHSAIYTQMGSPEPIISLSVSLVVIFVLGLIGFLAGIFPAKRAANIDPAIALRYK